MRRNRCRPRTAPAFIRCLRPVVLAWLVGLLACGDGGPADVLTPTPPAPVSVTVVPPSATLAALGQTVQLNTTVLDQSGQPMTGVSVSWASGDESVATVGATGLVTATGNGTTSITATVTGASISGVADVTVEQQPRDIALSSQQESFRALGDTVRLTARVLDANGHPVEDVVVDWVSNDVSVVSVDDSGLVTAIGEGMTSVLATSGPALGSVDFSVEQQAVAVQLSSAPDTLRSLGNTFQLTATGLDANGHVTGSTAFVWTSADESVVAVSHAGLITAVANGTTDVTATVQDGSASASVSVTVAQRARNVRIAEVVDSLVVGSTYQLAATAYDGNQHVVANASFEWSSSDESVATVDSKGVLAARDAGSVKITAAVMDSDATATITLWVTEPPSERDALVALYNATGGPNWGRSLYWLTDFPISVWDGVGTDDRDGLVVTVLYLHNNNLTGRLPSRLGSLTNLELLELSFNSLTGSIPRELGNLTALHTFALNSNGLTGYIPRELGNLAALEYLWLERNELAGPIPPELGSLTNALAIDLRRNNLAGPIPSELGNLANIRLLRLSHNGLSGSIPPELTELGRLESLNLSENNLTGPIPPKIGNLTRLASLDLSDNGLTGAIPPGIGNLARLGHRVCYSLPVLGVCEYATLNLSSNDLTGSIPPELGRLHNLTGLHLARNNLAGSIPPQLGNLNSLSALNLSSNDLTGSIPPELGRLHNLMGLHLAVNNLTGSIPPELGNLNSLSALNLASNNLTGSIPAELGELGSLQSLSLGSNDLTGSIPPELASLRSLRWLHLFQNQLTGSIPPELGNLDNLESLALRDNHLWGSIPPELGTLRNLNHLGLHRNNLTGALPPELGNLRQLKTLYLNGNGLTGRIPQEFTNLQLDYFQWNDTQLCAPANAAFQAWLRSIPRHRGGATCSSGGGT